MRVTMRPWVVLLAGGSGTRLKDLTRDGAGRAVPKQFWRFRGNKSMLGWTLDRAIRTAPAQRVLAVVAEQHRGWWMPELLRLPDWNVLSQPQSRGTAVGVLHALAEILERDPAPVLVGMPSDHGVEDEGILQRTIGAAVEAAEDWPDHLVLLGVRPDREDPDYGWILPEPAGAGVTRPVRTFVEKPPASQLGRLREQEAVWNSLIFACTGWALLHLYELTQPELLKAYARGMRGRLGEARSLRSLYAALPFRDFARDLLQHVAPHLRLLTVPRCGWTDLGTPPRVASWLARCGAARGAASGGRETGVPPGADALTAVGGR